MSPAWSSSVDEAEKRSGSPGRPESYVRRFSVQAARAPLALAAQSERGQLTYEELNRSANGLARRLQELGVGPEVLVGVCLERSLELLVSLLAVWKAGGAFVPLSPDYPPERLQYMQADAQAPVLITLADLAGRFAGSRTTFLCLDDPVERRRAESGLTYDPVASPSPDNLAYVIYTSGSTGRPKGVEITHRALLNHNAAIASIYGLGPHDRVLQFAPSSFDVSLEEIFPTWLSGGAVVLRTNDAIGSPARFLRFVAEQEISVLNLPTAFWHELVEHLAATALPGSVRLVVIGGEQASPAAYRKWKELVHGRIPLINAYGPTEATITSTCYVAQAADESLAIGRPIANTCALVLDSQLQPVPPGQTGELYLGGAGLARGYRNRSELTSQQFVLHSNDTGACSERLYRTGDRVRCRVDGNLEFVGRVDEQVKVRGYRIEPGEVEAALLSCSGILEAAVVAREEQPGRKRLVGYYVSRPGQEVAPATVREFLLTRLPGYMLPAVLVPLSAMPKSPAGKIDRQGLPAPQAPASGHDSSPAPRTAIEESLAKIWRDILRLERLGVDDDFFTLGGDSLLVMQVLSRIRDQFQAEVSWTQFFESPTLAGLARILEQHLPAPLSGGSHRAEPRPVARTSPLPASFVQERLWFLQQLSPQSSGYNMGISLRLAGRFDAAALQSALNRLTARHESLRTSFTYAQGQLHQAIAQRLPMALATTDLTHLAARRREAELKQLLKLEMQTAFDLARPPLVRARLFRLGTDQHVLSLVMHHAISDGWSLALLCEELGGFYQSAAGGGALPELPELPFQYADYACWQRESWPSSSLQAEEQYWKSKLHGAPARLSFPGHSPRSPHTRTQAARCSILLPKRLVRAAEAFAQGHRVTPFMVLLTALALALREMSGQSDLVIGTVVAGRTRSEFERVVGCFMNFLPLRVQLAHGATTREALAAVRQTVLDSQAHQDYPFEKLVTALNPRRDSTTNPIYNVALLWHNYPQRNLSWGANLTVHPVPLFQDYALLDLRFEAEPAGEQWSLACEFKTSQFEPSEIRTFLKACARHLAELVHSDRGTSSRKPFGTWLRELWTRSPARERV